MSFQDRFSEYDAIWDYSNPLKAQQQESTINEIISRLEKAGL